MRVLRLIKLEGRWEKYPVAKVNGRLDWGHVQRKGERIPAPAGTLYLEYLEDGHRRRRAVGSTAREAQAAMASQTSVLELRKRGVETQDAPEIQARQASRTLQGETVAQVVRRFNAAPPLGLRPTSVTKYSFDLNSFLEWTKKNHITHLSQLERQDIRDFMAYLVREQGLALKTAINKSVIVLKQMRDAGAEIAMKKGDWPRVTEKQPDVYTPEMLRPLFAAMLSRESALYQTFLLTGFRDQEIGFLAWTDFNERERTLRVSKKAGYNFDPKNYMERTIPIPPALAELLAAHRTRQEPGEYLVFPTSHQNVGRGSSGGQRDKHMLAKLKKIALRAGLNCGRCQARYNKKPASCRSQPICELWTLHKFRHTYATTLLRDGFDILTVQRLLGHQKIESTMKYLRGLQAGSLSEKMDKSAIATMFV